MEDVTIPAAASSPAPTEAPEESTPPPADDIGSMAVPKDPEAYAEWRQTGKLPSKEDSATSKEKPSPEDSATSRPSPEDSATSKRRTENRKEQINRELREAIAERDQARRERDQIRQEIEGAGKKDVKPPAEPSPAKPEPEALQRPVRPKQEDFDTWDKYQAADDQYLEDLADYKAAGRLEQHTAKLRQDAAQVRLNEAKTRYGEEAEPAILKTGQTVFDDAKVPPAIKAAIGRSKVLVDALYVMGSDQQELSDFLELAKADPIEALRKWFTIESLVERELAGNASKEPGETPPRASDGKFQSAKPRPAPAPTTELNGNASPPGDERERAANTGNVRAFFAEGNRRDMQRWKGNI